MKVASRDVASFCARPPAALPAALLYGTDPMRIALRRQELVLALVGPEGEAEMRLTRLAAADLKQGGTVADEMQAMGFFPGPRVVLLEGAGEAQGPAVADALERWCEGDATLVVAAGNLTPRSAIRKAFEAHRTAAALAIYDDPPDRAEIDAMLARSGLVASRDATLALHGLAQALDPGDFRQTLEKVALYKLGDAAELTAEEVAALAPATVEAAVDDLVNAAAEAEVGRLGPLFRRLEAQGVTPVSICIAAGRHFRMLLAAASAPDGAAAALGRMRPPVWGERRERMRRQASGWGARRLDTALQLIVDADLTLRSPSPTPDMALVERTLIRVAMLARR